MNFTWRAKAGKRCTRLAAIQSIYSLELMGKEPHAWKEADIEGEATRMVAAYRTGELSYPEVSDHKAFPKEPIAPKPVLLRHFLTLVSSYQEAIDAHIQPHLTAEWDLEKIGLLAVALFRLAAAEMLYNKDVPTPVILDEYTSIASYFWEDEQVGFVNAVLQKIAV